MRRSSTAESKVRGGGEDGRDAPKPLPHARHRFKNTFRFPTFPFTKSYFFRVIDSSFYFFVFQLFRVTQSHYTTTMRNESKQEYEDVAQEDGEHDELFSVRLPSDFHDGRVRERFGGRRLRRVMMMARL